MKHAAICITALLAGCATSSGVSTLGADTYNVTAAASLARGGISGAKQAAYAEANQECAKRSREIVVVKETVTPPSFFNGMHIVDLTFQCKAA